MLQSRLQTGINDLNLMTSRRHVTSRIVINYGQKLCAPFDPCESFALIRTQAFPPPFVKKEKKRYFFPPPLKSNECTYTRDSIHVRVRVHSRI